MIDSVYCTFKQEGTFNPSLVEKPVMPSPFIYPLLQNPAFLSPMHLLSDDVYSLHENKIIFYRLTGGTGIHIVRTI